MKKFILTPLAFTLLSFLALSCDNNDDSIDTSSNSDSAVIDSKALPSLSQKTIAESFPNETIISAKKKHTPSASQALYEAKLSNSFKLDFDKDGNWTDVDGGVQEIPSGLAPNKIGDYVSKHYPNSIITQIEREKNYYDVELSNDTDLIFDLQGNFKRVDADTDDDHDDDDDDDNDNTSADNLPVLSQQIITKGFPYATLVAVEKKNIASADGTLYETKLSNNFELDFDTQGDWTNIDGGIQKVPANLIPTKINNYVNQKYPQSTITQIEKERTHYEVDLSNNTDLIFDLQGNFIRIDTDNNNSNNNNNNNNDDDTLVNSSALPALSQKTIATNFPNATIILVEKNNIASADGTLYETKLSNNFEIDFNANGDWTEVNGHRQAVPASFIPTKINNYVSQKYPQSTITQIEKEPNYYEIELSNGISLVFNLQGNFVRIDR